MSDSRRVLMIAHGHPDLVAGGGELAAYQLHQALNQQEACDSVYFARHNHAERTRAGTALSGTGRDSEILFYSHMSDWFRFSQPDTGKIHNEFREVLEITQPDLVHFHHYLHLGLEMLREVRDFNPNIPIVLTLHEYFAICHNHGQMVRTTDQGLCTSASPAQCANCFPQHTPQDFFLRERFIKSCFELVDTFIAPSQFLAERYIEWGLPRSKMRVIDNVQVAAETPAVAARSPSSTADQQPVHFSFFGQFTKFKGLDVLLSAASLLPPDIRARLRIRLYGSGLNAMKPAARQPLEAQLREVSDCVEIVGAYRREELQQLMSDTDWVLMPSRWWENAPMVIEEARQFGVPVICSNIGGMAEKVENGVTGLHFRVADPADLAERIAWAVHNRVQQPEYAERMLQSGRPEQALSGHLGLYADLWPGQSAKHTLQAA